MSDDLSELLDGALQGGPRTTRAFVGRLRPIVQARVARVLLRFSSKASGRDVRQEVDDLTQEVFAQLFANGAHVLRSWSPTKGLSLANFIGLVAQRHATKMLMSARRSPWSEDPMLGPDLERVSGVTQDERGILQRDLLVRVVRQLRADLSPQANLLFEVLLVERRPIPEVVELTGLSSAALYQWRSRLVKRVRSIAAQWVSDSHAWRKDHLQEGTQ